MARRLKDLEQENAPGSLLGEWLQGAIQRQLAG